MSSPKIAGAEAPSATPLRAGTKRARTREKLLDVAAELFAERGISAVSLDEVAANAGLTKGAIYGNFASKDDLVFAVATERIQRPSLSFEGDAPVREQVRAMVKRSFARSKKMRKHFAFLAELDLYTLTREELSKRFLASARERHLKSAAYLEAVAGQLAMPPLQFVLVAQGLLSGLLFQQACFPDIVTEEVVNKAVDALFA